MKRALHGVIAGILLAACSAGAVAQAIDEVEPNYRDAQPLERGADGKYAVKGVIGFSEWYLPADQDVDLYSFYARKDDLLEIDIDYGMKPKCGNFPPRCVDTTLTILGPDPDYPVLRQDKTCLAGRWGNSVDNKDPCILNFLVKTDGIYIVAVTGDGTTLLDGGHVVGSTSSNGEYQLIVSGASASLQVINIDIKPRSRAFTRPDLKSKGNIPVALFSKDGFDALKVDRDSLTFGAKGDEKSLRNCAWEGEYVDADDKLDLVCHFDKQAANFGPENLEGVLNGTINGKPFEGRSVLKVLPELQQENAKKQK
ncbi:MAG: hypothetical protein ACREUZ_07455 [Burkholderiales bacterium]